MDDIPHREHESQWDRDELESLRWHWQGPYSISLEGGTWHATREGGTALAASTATTLRAKIRADYRRSPAAAR